MTDTQPLRLSTGFWFTLGAAADMGFESPLPDLPIDADTGKRLAAVLDRVEIGRAETDEAFHDLVCLGEALNVKWFDDPVWALAFRDRLRELGVKAVIGHDLEPTWEQHGTAASPTTMVIYAADLVELATDRPEDFSAVTQLHLSVEETFAAMYCEGSGAAGPDGTPTERGQEASYFMHGCESRLAAVTLCNVLTADGREAWMMADQRWLTDGSPYLRHVVVTSVAQSNHPDWKQWG